MERTLTPRRYVAALPTVQERDYALAHLAYLRGETDRAPFDGAYSLSFKPAQAIRRRLGTLTS